MTWRGNRIFTTHAGSLPRPARLVQLYADRFSGHPIDEAELAREVAQATEWVVKRQGEAGVDIPNNGEQGRESLFLYVQRRMAGFGGWGFASRGAICWIAPNLPR